MSTLSFRQRVSILRDTKIRHTKEKLEQAGYMDSDDHATIPLPKGYKFNAIKTGDGPGFYGPIDNVKNFELMLDTSQVYVDPMEILCGRWSEHLQGYRHNGVRQYKKVDANLDEKFDLYGIIPGIGADAHCACDYEIGLSLGFGGILEKIQHYRSTNENESNTEFYKAEERTVIAIIQFIDKHIEKIKEVLKKETRPEIVETLTDMLAANERVRYHSPETFLEACQFIAWFNIVSRIYNRDGAGCNLDVILFPYYERDINAKIIDDDKATFILSNLILIETHYYQLSGADKDDNDRTNKLTYMILEAAHWLNSSANLTIRIHDNINPLILRKGVEYLFTDRNGWPRFSGDRGLMNYQKNRGATKEIARKRIAVGCNWMALPGMEYPLNDCVKINTAKSFELAFYEMLDCTETEPSVERLFEIFDQNLKNAVEYTAQGIEHHMKYQAYAEPELVMNLMMQNTIEMGQDISECAIFKTMGIDGVALGTVADSFAAVEQRVEREKLISWEELRSTLTNNFEGVQGQRIRDMLKSSERYCQGNSLGDKWAKRISETFSAHVASREMPNDIQLVPGWFSWSNTIQFGKQVGATPDGRAAYAPVTHGANPNPGFRTDGAVTAMASGVAAVQTNYGNTCPLQLEFDPKLSKEEGGIERVEQILKTHADLGGTLININVLNKEKLFKAHENPSLYPDLVVRVTGFTSYFMVLSPEFRQLVIDRFIDGM